MSKTYNKDAFGFPDALFSQVYRLKFGLTYSRHALTEALNDKYGVLPAECFPKGFDMADGWTLVEIEESAPGCVSKIVVRRQADKTRSLVLVIIPARTGTVKTLWTNLNTDDHKTLDKSKFDKPQSA